MSSSSSKSAPPPPITNLQLQHEPAIDIPPDPGNSSHSPLTNSIESSDDHNPTLHQQNGNNTQTVTLRQVLHYYWWGTNEHQSNNHNIASHPTPPQIWMAQNVYPLVTPMRMICFLLIEISFILAYGFYMQTNHYKTHVASGGHHLPLIVFVAANIGNFVFLILVMFFNFFTAAYEGYLHQYYLFKALGELMVMLVTSFLILEIGHKHQEEPYEVAGLVTCAFLTIYSLCTVILVKPGHHCSLLESTETLTMHLGLVGIYGVPVVVFIFVILVIKNYFWSHNIGQARAPSDEVVDNLSRV